MNRRKLGKLFVATAAAQTLGLHRPAEAQVTQLRMTESGGTSGESVEAGYIKPFTAKTGIKVIRDSPNNLGKLRALVESGVTSTTIFELGAASLEQAKALKLVEKLDWSKIAPMPIFPEAKDDFGMGYQYYSSLMSWRTDAKSLNTWADFFNAKEFPGKRTVPSDPVYVLPAVLLAFGIPMDKLYPLDIDLAFRHLDEVKHSVAVWWKSGSQAPQLLRDNEVQYAIAYSGRVVGQKGIAYTYNQANLNLSYFCIVAGAGPANAEAAYGLLREMSDPKNQAIASAIIPYTGNSPDEESLLPKDRLHEFPTTSHNKKVQYLNDMSWWFDNADMVQKRWQEFTLKL